MRENVERSAARSEDEKRPVEKELAELRKEVLESRNLVIKTDNLLKNLFAELKAVAKKNDDQYRRTWFSAGAAYLVFVALAAAVAMLGARASVASERARVETAQSEADQARKRAEDLAAQLAKTRQDADLARGASERAVAVYRMLSEGDGEARLKGVDELAKLDRARLNPLEIKALDERARELKKELGQAAFERGAKAHRREDWRTAASELKRYLALDPEGSDANQAAYFAGNALYNLKDHAGAVPLLERFVTRGKGTKGADYAWLLLGQSEEALGHFEKAQDAYKRGTTEYPGSEFVPAMQQRFRIAQQSAVRAAGGAAAVPQAVAPAAHVPAPLPRAVAPTSAPAPAPAPTGSAFAPPAPAPAPAAPQAAVQP